MPVLDKSKLRSRGNLPSPMRPAKHLMPFRPMSLRAKLSNSVSQFRTPIKAPTPCAEIRVSRNRQRLTFSAGTRAASQSKASSCKSPRLRPVRSSSLPKHPSCTARMNFGKIERLRHACSYTEQPGRACCRGGVGGNAEATLRLPPGPNAARFVSSTGEPAFSDTFRGSAPSFPAAAAAFSEGHGKAAALRAAVSTSRACSRGLQREAARPWPRRPASPLPTFEQHASSFATAACNLPMSVGKCTTESLAPPG
mmetsp:Transcript_72111/g.207034  ORF Transcript_72111/g.207034 Transcript_72111/m.207034 type:complete len:253 (+) Transcript_72111:555-1313(+)